MQTFREQQEKIRGAFFNEQCGGEQQNGKDQRSLKKIGDIKGTFHSMMGMIQDINDKDLTEAKEIKKKW